MKTDRLIHRVLDVFDELYPGAGLALNFSNPFELVVAVLLSARCTDERVNMVTHDLFKHVATPVEFLDADIGAIEQLVRPTGFYRNKAKLLMGCCEVLHKRFHDEVPEAMEDLMQLPGIGRKSANMIRGNAFGLPGIAVDTHVQRVSFRLGFSKHKDPIKIEKDLGKLIPENRWTVFSNQAILFGREICMSRKPRCSSCALNEICPFESKTPRNE